MRKESYDLTYRTYRTPCTLIWDSAPSIDSVFTGFSKNATHYQISSDVGSTSRSGSTVFYVSCPLVQPLTWLLLVTLGAYGIIPLTWSFSKRNVAGF